MRATAVVVTFAIMVTAYGDLTPPPPPRRPAVVWGEGAKAATLRLRAEVEVKGEVVRVTDVAVLEGSSEMMSIVVGSVSG